MTLIIVCVVLGGVAGFVAGVVAARTYDEADWEDNGDEEEGE